jgi:hypothetical protein
MGPRIKSEGDKIKEGQEWSANPRETSETARIMTGNQQFSCSTPRSAWRRGETGLACGGVTEATDILRGTVEQRNTT